MEIRAHVVNQTQKTMSQQKPEKTGHFGYLNNDHVCVCVTRAERSSSFRVFVWFLFGFFFCSSIRCIHLIMHWMHSICWDLGCCCVSIRMVFIDDVHEITLIRCIFYSCPLLLLLFSYFLVITHFHIGHRHPIKIIITKKTHVPFITYSLSASAQRLDNIRLSWSEASKKGGESPG